MLFWGVFYQIFDLWFNCLSAKYVDLRFRNIVWILQILNYLPLVLESTNKLTAFHINFDVQKAIYLASKCTSFLLCS